MNARQREQAKPRVEVYTDDGITLKLRAPVYCHRSINGERKYRRWDGSVRTAP